MKFGKKIRFECVSEWSNKYISYGKLKKYLRYLYRSDLKPIGEAQEAHLLINGFPAINQQQLSSISSDNQSDSTNSSPVLNENRGGSLNNSFEFTTPPTLTATAIANNSKLRHNSISNNSGIDNNNINNNNNNNNAGDESFENFNDDDEDDDTVSCSSRKSSMNTNEKTPLINVLDHNGKQIKSSSGNGKKNKRHHQIPVQPTISVPVFTQAERERLFINKIDEELKKINDFFSIKEKDIILHYNKLTEHCSLILKDRNPSPKILKNIQKAFGELYKGLTMLENFVALNYQGFEKILKKYDRMAPAENQIKPDQIERIKEEKFYNSKSWRNMKEDVELLYCKIFKLDKISIAKKKLQPFSESQSTDYHMLKLGFAIGVSMAILVFVIILFTNKSVIEPDWTRFTSTIPIFRAVGIPILAVWLWGVNVYVWDRARVNYILIFGLDPRTSIDHRRIWKTASFLTAIWLTTFLLFCGTVTGNFTLGNIPAQVYPLVLVIFFLSVVLFPFRFFHRKSRKLLFITLGNVIITPFGSTKFRALFLGDLLTSMVKTIFDFEYTACYFFTGDWMINDSTRCNQVNAIALPILSGLPLLWRFMQCILRYRETKNRIHLGNSTKYAVGFSVVLFSALNGNYQAYEPWSASRILWCICFVLSTLYMYCWDVVVDWGFLWLGKPRPLLRHQLMYKKHMWSYYYVLFSNLILRFAWTLTITKIPFELPINTELFNTITASIEIVRRFTWSIFRVENEHICNSIQYHAFDFSEAPWKNEVPKIESPKSLLPLSSQYPFGQDNSGAVGSPSSGSNNLFLNNNNNVNNVNNVNNNNFNNAFTNATSLNGFNGGSYTYDNQYSIWKKSSKQYYSTSLLDSIKKKFFNKK